ncbi:unnamed protein product, partial [Amaranthus hypochondriacus]
MKLRDGKVIGEESEEEELIFSLEEFFNLATSSGEIVLNYFNMANQSLKELAAPTFDNQPLCIVFPEITTPFKLHSGFIQLLPVFRGLPGEDPHRHLKEFHVVCSTMKPENIEEDIIKLRAFPFSLQDSAKDWLYYLSPGSFTTWNDIQSLFLEKYFPASRVASIRKEICGIRQFSSETLYEYWERFKR